jgi:hypothetical protein
MCCFPSDPHIGFITLAVIFVSATLLGFASHSPGGIGVFDAAMLVALWQFDKEDLLAGPSALPPALLHRAIRALARHSRHPRDRSQHDRARRAACRGSRFRRAERRREEAAAKEIHEQALWPRMTRDRRSRARFSAGSVLPQFSLSSPRRCNGASRLRGFFSHSR